jgi:hypothetical protein
LKANNPVEKLFYGRADIQHAGSAYYFTKDSLLQHLIIQLKYRGNKEAGYFLGRMMGTALSQSEKFSTVDVLVPLPLNPKKNRCVATTRPPCFARASTKYGANPCSAECRNPDPFYRNTNPPEPRKPLAKHGRRFCGNRTCRLRTQTHPPRSTM